MFRKYFVISEHCSILHQILKLSYKTAVKIQIKIGVN